MKKNRKKQNLLIIALVLVVGVMSVYFAWTASTTLNVLGSADTAAESWNVVFYKDDTHPISTEGTTEGKTITIDIEKEDATLATIGTGVNDYYTTGQQIKFTIPVKNTGSKGASLTAAAYVTTTDPEESRNTSDYDSMPSTAPTGTGWYGSCSTADSSIAASGGTTTMTCTFTYQGIPATGNATANDDTYYFMVALTAASADE